MLLRRFLYAILIGLAVPGAVQAGVLSQVTSTVTYNPILSNYDYQYLLTNPLENELDGDPDFFLDFSIEISSSSNLTNITTPVGWFNTAYLPGDTLVEWAVLDLADALAPGQSLIFGFSSELSPGDTNYGIVALNVGGGDFSSGLTLGPVDPIMPNAVPEPSSLTLFGLTAIGLCAYTRRRLPKPPHRLETC